MLDQQSPQGAPAPVPVESNPAATERRFPPVPDGYLGPRVLSVDELLAVLRLKSRTSAYRYEAYPDFPQRIRLGDKHVVWDADEVAAWLEARKAERLKVSAPASEEPAKRKRGGVRKTLVMA